jgi:hypothetical protein
MFNSQTQVIDKDFKMITLFIIITIHILVDIYKWWKGENEKI